MEYSKKDNKEDVIGWQIKEGLDRIDSDIKVDLPDMNHFRQLVSNTQAKKTKKDTRQFLVFIITALAVLGFETFTFMKLMHVFVAIQVLALLIVPFSIYFWLRQQHGKADIV